MLLFVNQLTNVDFSYLDATRGLVGESWLASIRIQGKLDDQGMVCDFGTVKQTVRQFLDRSIDHCLVIPTKACELICHTPPDANEQNITWHYQDEKQLSCRSPKEAFCFVDTKRIDSNSLAHWCEEQLAPLLPETITTISIEFSAEAQQPYYHYSHGLKKHQGNCQRIAHGHRSTIRIFRQNQRDEALEKQWCQHWQDIYIGSEDNLISTTDKHGRQYYDFAYQAQQGAFFLSLPCDDCDIISTETTVEWLAQHIAKTLKQQEPSVCFTVYAYEGIGKGASITL